MNPLLFGSRARQLFGVHVPASGARKRRGAVVCAPWGHEYVRSHRSSKVLGDRLARAGCDVLRFDYYGTGDSAGEAEEVTLGGLVDDAVTAVEELEDLAQVRRVTLVGLRLGAAVAAMAAARLASVDRLVLWDPISDGASFVEKLTAGRDPEGVLEVRGFPLTPGFRKDLTDLGAAAFASPVPETLLIVSETSDEHQHLRESLAAGNRRVDYEVLPSPPCWVEEGDFGVGAVPANIMDRIAAWQS